VRRFRVDRIDALTELDEPSAPPAEASASDMRDGVFQPSGSQPMVTLRVGRASRWITEYYPCEEVVAEADGRWLVSLRASDLAWARRLVMGLGRDTEVVRPAELAAEIRSEAAAALAAYGVQAPTDGAARPATDGTAVARTEGTAVARTEGTAVARTEGTDPATDGSAAPGGGASGIPGGARHPVAGLESRT
jgi:proteasome accessory factor C